MSLQVWLPLNGSLNNQGLNNTSVSLQNGTPTYNNNGKIGKCLYNSSTGSNITIPYNFYNTEQLSIAFWVKPNSPTAWMDLFSIGQYANRMETNNSNGDMYYLFSDNNSYSLAAGSTQIFPMTNNIWHHIVYTIDGNNVKIYQNGILKLTTPQLHSLSTAIGNYPYILIGRRRSSENSYYKGYFNDVRIYDHALSTKEVKDLAKGLVLHYRLAGPGQENLITSMSAGGRTTLIDKYTLNADFGQNVDTYGYINVSPALELNKTYTLSFDVLNMPVGSRWGFQLWNNNNYHFWIEGNGHYSYTFCPSASKLPSGYNLNRFLFDDSSRTNPAGIVTFTNFKIEEGSIATPWCPHKDDPLYSAMGYNNNIEYDCSGYCRNGTKSGNIAWDIDSPRYTTSYHFSNSQSINYIENLTFLTTGSISFWAKFNTKGSAGWLPFTGQNGRYYVMATSGGTGNFYNDNIAAVGTIKYYEDSKSVSAPKNDGKWHHYVITGINMSGWTIFKINNYSPEWNSDVNYSDVRVYNTILSAEDIAELYHSAVIVDNTGKTYAYEYFEAN